MVIQMVMQYVAFSGGKDSTALALLYPDAIPVFTDTKWEHQEVYDHITRFERVTGREVVRIVNDIYPGGIPEYIKHSNFFPNHGARYCTDKFKIQPMNKYLSSNLPAELLIGLRADEPADQRVGNLTSIEGLTIRYPMRERGIALMGVLKICLEYGLLPRYPAYMARGGCKGCFYKRKAQVYAMARFAPDVIRDLSELEQGAQDKRGKFFYMFGNVGKSLEDVIAETSLQPAMFSDEEIYREIESTELGVNCGLFCRR